MSKSQAALGEEAGHVHSCFFPFPAPQAVVERYVAANQLCFPHVDEDMRHMLESIVSRHLDVEAKLPFGRYNEGTLAIVLAFSLALLYQAARNLHWRRAPAWWMGGQRGCHVPGHHDCRPIHAPPWACAPLTR